MKISSLITFATIATAIVAFPIDIPNKRSIDIIERREVPYFKSPVISIVDKREPSKEKVDKREPSKEKVDKRESSKEKVD